jgi:opacity protein-like surface antigen
MKNTLKKFGLGLVFAILLTTAANASTLYNWVPDEALNGGISSSGTLTEINTGNLSPFSFTFDSLATDTTVAVTAGRWYNPASTYSGQAGDGNYTFTGTSDAGASLTWTIVNSSVTGTPNEDKVTDGTHTLYGDWVPVPVPEPTTISLLLLALGASALRIWRRR